MHVPGRLDDVFVVQCRSHAWAEIANDKPTSFCSGADRSPGADTHDAQSFLCLGQSGRFGQRCVGGGAKLRFRPVEHNDGPFVVKLFGHEDESIYSVGMRMNDSAPSLGHVVWIFGRQAVVAAKAFEMLSREVCELQRAVIGASRKGHQIARVDLFLPNLELTLLRDLIVQDGFCDGRV